MDLGIVHVLQWSPNAVQDHLHSPIGHDLDANPAERMGQLGNHSK